jgi:hypothetical protein
LSQEEQKCHSKEREDDLREQMDGELQRIEERYCRQHEQLLASIVDRDSQDGVVSGMARSISLFACA